MSQMPPIPPNYQQAFMKPHRGGMILAFGLIGVLVCFPFSIVAWVMGANDLREMRQGLMDPSGKSLTEAGKIIGMVWVLIACIGFLVWIVFFVVLAGVGLAGAASGSRGGP
jgi:hypothetical protein